MTVLECSFGRMFGMKSVNILNIKYSIISKVHSEITQKEIKNYLGVSFPFFRLRACAIRGRAIRY